MWLPQRPRDRNPCSQHQKLCQVFTGSLQSDLFKMKTWAHPWLLKKNQPFNNSLFPRINIWSIQWPKALSGLAPAWLSTFFSYSVSLVCAYTATFKQHITIKCLLCARPCSRFMGNGSNWNRQKSLLLESGILVRETDKQLKYVVQLTPSED